MADITRDITESAERHSARLIALQRDLHAHPELGFEEARTAGIVAAEMRRAGLDVRTGLARTGVVADLVGRGSGPAVALRADMDAFPLEEAEGLPWRSLTPGVAHVCGHDAHVAIAAGVAGVLSELREQTPGTVRFIFQPAEERPLVEDDEDRPYWEGVTGISAAQVMVEEGALDLPGLVAVYGMHLWPWLPLGRIGIEEGPAMAGVANWRARVLGRSAHGAMPHDGVDSIVAVAQILNMLQLIVSRQTAPAEPLVITVGTIRGGDRRNVVPDRVDLTATVRALSWQLLEEVVPRRLRAVFRGVTEALGASYELEYCPLIKPVLNDRALAARARADVAAALGADAVVPMMERAMTSDDFAWLAERLPGLYLKVGCGDPKREVVPLHNRGFCFPPETIQQGIVALSAVLIGRLNAG